MTYAFDRPSHHITHISGTVSHQPLLFFLKSFFFSFFSVVCRSLVMLPWVGADPKALQEAWQEMHGWSEDTEAVAVQLPGRGT
jgi:hypothetical protein